MNAAAREETSHALDPHRRERLARRCFPLVARVVGRMRIPPGSHDDLVQEGWLALWGRMHRYRPSRGSFERWARCTVRYAVLDHLRAHGGTVVRVNRRQARACRAAGRDLATLCVSLDDAGRAGPGPLASLAARGDDPADAAERRDLRETALRRLPAREREVLELLYPARGAIPLTLREAGRRLRISESRVAQIRDAALRLARPTPASA